MSILSILSIFTGDCRCRGPPCRLFRRTPRTNTNIYSLDAMDTTGCPISQSWLCFLPFSWKNLPICQVIGTRILKIDSEIAAPHFRNWYFAISQRQKNNFYVTGGNFNLNYLSHFWIDFQNSCAWIFQNFPNFCVLNELCPRKWQKNFMTKTDLWDTL